MQHKNEIGLQEIQLEAPGDFLSELLGVVEAAVIPLDGVVRELPAARGWRVIAPLEGSLRAASGELSLPLEPGNAFAVGMEDEVSLLPASPCRVGLLTLCGSVADRVLQACASLGGLFFERGGEAVTRMLRLLSSGHRRVPAREASELGYSLLMSLYGTGSAGPAGRHVMPPVVEAALGIIRRDYAFLEGIAELAERLEVSQEYLTRCFCKYTGITPGKYLNQVRIENACSGRDSIPSSSSRTPAALQTPIISPASSVRASASIRASTPAQAEKSPFPPPRKTGFTYCNKILITLLHAILALAFSGVIAYNDTRNCVFRFM